MGQHVWLLLATILTELLVITKWSKGQFTEPLPMHIRWAWAIGGILLVLYPALRVSTSLVFPSALAEIGNSLACRAYGGMSESRSRSGKGRERKGNETSLWLLSHIHVYNYL
jgi:hypothetical protein